MVKGLAVLGIAAGLAVGAWSGFYIGGSPDAASKGTSSAGKKVDVCENEFVVFSADGRSASALARTTPAPWLAANRLQDCSPFEPGSGRGRLNYHFSSGY